MFNNLEEYYKYIESNIDNVRDISSNLTELRNKTVDKDLKCFYNYEIYIHDFNIINNTLQPIHSFHNIDGKQEYPKLELFEDNLEYLKLRATEIINHKLKAKYNHILWLSRAKNIGFAKVAIDNYFIYLKSLPNPHILTSDFYAEAFKNLFLLSQQVSYLKKEVLDYLLSILGTEHIQAFQEFSIMECVVSEGKKINETLKVFYVYINDIIDKDRYPNFLKEYLKLQLIIAQKINESLTPYYNKLAELYIEESKSHKGTFAVQIYYQKALAKYKKAGNKEKIEEISVLMEKAKKNINLKLQKFEFSNPTLDKYFNQIESKIDNLINNFDSDILYEHLILCQDIFPKPEDLKNNINSSLLELVSVVKFDQNRNISNKGDVGFNMYKIYIMSISVHHLSRFFRKGFESGKLSFESINNYLSNSTWYGYDAAYNKSDGSKIQFKWEELILPSLLSFFIQTKVDYRLNIFNHQAYILSIDSLTLKFEGLLREFSRRIGAQTIEIKEDSIEERISFEKLFENKKLVEIIPADDLAFFKFLFTNKGMDLRNNIAHCFYKPKDYKIEMMWFLIVAILKLGNFKFETAKS